MSLGGYSCPFVVLSEGYISKRFLWRVRGRGERCPVVVTLLYHKSHRGNGDNDRQSPCQGGPEINVELLLANHPQDCLICDRNGNCELQQLTFTLGINSRRFERTRKERFAKDESSLSLVRDPENASSADDVLLSAATCNR